MSTKTKPLNITKVVELSQKNRLANAAFKTLSQMEKSRPTTDLGRFKARLIEEHGLSVDKKEVTALFRQFQEAGLGRLVLARDNNHPHRFEWSYNNVEVGKSAITANSGAMALRPEPIPPSDSPITRIPSLTTPPDSIVLSLPLRGRLYSFYVPADLTKGEGQELCALINRFAR